MNGQGRPFRGESREETSGEFRGGPGTALRPAGGRGISEGQG